MLDSPAKAFLVCALDGLAIIWLWRALFPTWDDMWQAIYYVLKPDLLSYFDGEWVQDHFHSAKLGVAVVLTGLLLSVPMRLLGS